MPRPRTTPRKYAVNPLKRYHVFNEIEVCTVCGERVRLGRSGGRRCEVWRGGRWVWSSTKLCSGSVRRWKPTTKPDKLKPWVTIERVERCEGWDAVKPIPRMPAFNVVAIMVDDVPAIIEVGLITGARLRSEIGLADNEYLDLNGKPVEDDDEIDIKGGEVFGIWAT